MSPPRLTTINLHDLARLATTYGVTGCYVVTPFERQRRLADRMVSSLDRGATGLPIIRRGREALQNLCVVGSLAECRCRTRSKPLRPRAPAPSPRTRGGCRGARHTVTCAHIIWRRSEAFLLLLGTGWGLAADLMDGCDYMLAPIAVGERYNHLPVRVAAGIMLDPAARLIRAAGSKRFDR